MLILQDDVTDDKKFRRVLAKEIESNSFNHIKCEIDKSKKQWKHLWNIDDKFSNEDLENIKSIMLTKYDGFDMERACDEFVDYMYKNVLNVERIMPVTEFLIAWRRLLKWDDNDSIPSPDDCYTIRGEVYNFRKVDDDKTKLTITLAQYKNKKYHFLPIRFSQIPDNFDLLKQYSFIEVNGHVRKTGPRNKLDLYSTYREQIFILGKSFKVVSDNPEVINQWAEKVDPNWYDKKKNDFASIFNRIGLIASNTKNSAGASDFKHVLESTNFEIIDYPVESFSVQNIVDAIKKADTDTRCDCICIVRGGGNPYSLIKFNHPSVLEAIFESKHPVVVGIGHSTDDERLWCNKVADKACITPSEAARFFVYLISKWDYESHNKQ